MKIVNTQEFRREALYFLKHKRYDCGIPGTLEYKQWWDEQEKRCKEGYSVGGVRITGEHYGYLNFCQIELVDETKKNNEAVKDARRMANKTLTFPSFWDGDYRYFHIKEIAKSGCSREDFEALGLGVRVPDISLQGALHLSVLKKRRAGYSYKNAWIVANMYNLFPGSTSLITAYSSKYLYPGGAMSMASSFIHFINDHTDWRKRKLIDQKDIIKSGYKTIKDGVEVEKGFRSQIMAYTFNNDTDVVRGKDAKLILIEEGGKAPNLNEFYQATRASTEAGMNITGQILLYGTGGGDNTNWEDFEEIFYNPESYGMMSFYNDWDEQMSTTTCSLFVPEWQNMPGRMDDDGNSLKEAATAFANKERDIVRTSSKNSNTLDLYVMERPFTPAEALRRTGSNFFPIDDLNNHLQKLIATNNYKNVPIVGDLYNTDTGVQFKLNATNKPIYSFPTREHYKTAHDLKGSVVIFHKPYKVDGKIPDNLYIVCNDPYANEGISDSLGSVYVIMNPNNLNPPGDKIVACYNARPDTLDEFNSKMFLLAEYYNAKIGFENDRGDVIGYAKRFKKLHLLEEQFELAYDEKIKTSTSTKRGYGMHIGSGKENLRKLQGDSYIKDWLTTQRGVDENGVPILNLHTIYDIGLLQELIKYTIKGNFDRVSAFRIGMYHQRELVYKEVTVRKSFTKTNGFFQTALYQ